MMTFNLVLVMSTGYVHEVKITGLDWTEVKSKEMSLMKIMMEIDFWSEIVLTLLIEIKEKTREPRFSVDYDEFYKQIETLRGRTSNIN